MTSQDIEVHNGLRQGCPLAPSLFNLYFFAMVANWRDCCSQAGVNVLYKHGRKLVSDRTAKSKLNRTKITESQFADDAAVYTTTRNALEVSTRMFVDIAQQWGLTVSTSKTKGLVVGHHTVEEEDPVTVGSDVIEIVPSFTYLGSIITQDGRLESEPSSRIAKAARAFGVFAGVNLHQLQIIHRYQEVRLQGRRDINLTVWSRTMECESSPLEAPECLS